MMNFPPDVPAKYAIPLMLTLSGLQRKAEAGVAKKPEAKSKK